MQSAISSYERGEYQKALTEIKEEKPRKKDGLLYLLDKGMILHAAGEYKKSLSVFDKADDLADRINKSAGHEALSMATNDNALPYVGAKFERLLIPILKALNRAALGEISEALIDIRRYHTLHHAFYGLDGPTPAFQNPFNTYFSGIIWEANGFQNDAEIDYRAFEKMTGEEERESLRRLKRASPLKNLKMGGDGELIFVLEAGLSPERISSEGQDPQTLELFPVPKYEERHTQIDHAEILVRGEARGETVPLVSLSQLAIATLDKEMPKIIAKAIGRTALKEAAAVTVGETVDEDLGFALGLLVLATNRADLRHWKTLPETLQIARLKLPAGTHDITIRFVSRSGGSVGQDLVLPPVTIESGKTVFIPYRTFD